MEKPWESSTDSLENMEHGARAKFHGFHAGMEQENCKNILHESMESESMGIYKNESMGNMVFSSTLLLIISRKHGKHGKYGKV